MSKLGCPFCEGTNIVVWDSTGDQWVEWTTSCEGCGASVSATTKEEAIKLWNVRASTDALGKVNVLEGLINEIHRTAYYADEDTYERNIKRIITLTQPIVESLADEEG